MKNKDVFHNARPEVFSEKHNAGKGERGARSRRQVMEGRVSAGDPISVTTCSHHDSLRMPGAQ